MLGYGTVSRRQNVPPPLQRSQQYGAPSIFPSTTKQAAEDTQGGPYIVLVSINETFETKTIRVPHHPDAVRIGRQTNKSTVPLSDNGYFDSKVLSRSHAEVWSDAESRVFIKDIKSSNGTFVNGSRLSKENEESEPRELLRGDTLELGIDILNDENGTVVHRKVSAHVDYVGSATDSRAPQALPRPYNRTVDDAKKQSDAPNPTDKANKSANYRTYDNSANVSNVLPNGVMTGQSQPSRGRQAITIDQVIKRLSTDLKASQLVALDLRHTFELVSSQTPQAIAAISEKSPFKSEAKIEIPQDVNISNGSPSPRIPIDEDNFSGKLDGQVARIAELESSLLLERESRMFLEEKCQILADSYSTTNMNNDDDIDSTTSEQTVLSTDRQIPRGTDELTADDGGTVERLGNQLRDALEQVEHYKKRAQLAETENAKQSALILRLQQQQQQQHSSRVRTPTTEVKSRDKGGRGAALVGMVGIMMLGIGVMSFLNDYGPKKDF